MNRPLLSICIVNWNTCSLLRECLASIYSDPAANNWEIIVVDNASFDDSVEMVRREFSEVRLLVSSSNLGFVGANNWAMQEALADYWLLLNSDTRVEIGSLTSLVDFMDQHPEAAVVGPKLIRNDGSIQPSCGVTPSFLREFANKLLLHKVFPTIKFGRRRSTVFCEVGWVTGACLMVRKCIGLKVGLLDSAFFMFYEDLEWCIRIGKDGGKIFYCPTSIVVHVGGQSTRKNFAEMLVLSHKSLIYLYEKYFNRFEFTLLCLMVPVEMTIRFVIWSLKYCFQPYQRSEAGQRLRAYCYIIRGAKELPNFID
ncbi:MAG: glycosyltransferase family 2 protein [Candidatus Latescibacterota bacterium]|nr:glycosyltransferase family 2 protein [Candidatus Latescibacterota bacterium]